MSDRQTGQQRGSNFQTRVSPWLRVVCGCLIINSEQNDGEVELESIQPPESPASLVDVTGASTPGEPGGSSRSGAGFRESEPISANVLADQPVVPLDRAQPKTRLQEKNVPKHNED